MKVGWQTKSLGDLCDVIAGQSPEGKYYNADGIGLPFYQGKKDFGEKFLKAPTTWTSETTKTARKDDILMSVRAPVGPINFANETICIGRGLAAIRCSEQLDRDYLFYQLLHLQPEIAGREGAVFASINKTEISELSIAVAPMSEQKRIVAILDTAFAQIASAKANAEQNLLNARALFESYLNKVFTERGDGWQTVPFGEIAAFRNGINFTKSSRGTPIKILGVKDFQNHYWAQFEDFDSIVPEGLVPDPDTLIEGDIVFVRSNGNPDLIGRCLLIGQLPERTTHSGFTIKARLQQDSVLPAYLCHFLKSKDTRQEMIDGGNGANIKSLNQGTLSRIVVPFPSLSKQAEIVRQLEDMQVETQRLESLNQQKLAALDELKKSLLHQAFSGAL